MALEADVAFEDHNWLHLRATKKVAQAFAAHNLFLGDHVDMPVNPDFIIRIPKTARFENFTSNHGQIYSAGAFSYSENGVTEAVVGRYCSIAHNFWAMGERHPMERVTQSSFTYCHFPHWHKPQFLRAHQELLGDAYRPDMPPIGTGPLPVLEHDVWIGQQVIVQRGVTVRTGAVVGAGSVVTRDVPPYTIVAGNPARPIRTRFAPELCQRLLATEWWNHHPRILYEFGYADVEKFCQRLEDARAAGPLPPMPVRALDWRNLLQALSES